MLNAVEGLLIVARTVVKATVQIIVEAAHTAERMNRDYPIIIP
jgi:hypothetical protein